jgi:hypothetical protein
MNQGPRGDCFMKKTKGRKSRDTVPLIYSIVSVIMLTFPASTGTKHNRNAFNILYFILCVGAIETVRVMI